MKPNDIVQPTALCLSLIRRFSKCHRGIALTYPDRYKAVMVKWDHRPEPVMMAGRYVEACDEDTHQL